MGMAEHVCRSQCVGANLQRAVDLAEAKQYEAQRRFGVHFGILSKLMRRGGVALGRVQSQRMLELLLCFDGLALSEQDRTEHAVPDDPARFAPSAFGQ